MTKSASPHIKALVEFSKLNLAENGCSSTLQRVQANLKNIELYSKICISEKQSRLSRVMSAVHMESDFDFIDMLSRGIARALKAHPTDTFERNKPAPVPTAISTLFQFKKKS